MFLLNSVNFMAWPVAATFDEIQPWMIAAIAGAALLALLLLLQAARKSRKKKHGDQMREAMSGAKQDIQNTGEIWKDFEPIDPENTGSAVATTEASKTAGGKSGRGRHAK